MIRYTQDTFDARAVIEQHLVTPTHVVSDGLLGKFDTLRVALEHLQTHGTANTTLAILARDGELQFTNDGLTSLCEGFAAWLYDAGLTDYPEDRTSE